MNDCIYNYGIDRPQFRTTAQLLKEYANTVNSPQYMQPTVIETLSDGSIITAQSNAFLGDTDNFLYQTLISYDQALYLIELNPELSVAEIPFDGKSVGYSFLLIVNPYSDNLEETLMLVKALSEKKMSEMQVNPQPDLNGEQQLNIIYQNSTVIMGVPNEIYYSDYEKYLSDKITLNDFIIEASQCQHILTNNKDKNIVKTTKSKKHLKWNTKCKLCLIPSLLGTAVFFVIPFIRILYYSLIDNQFKRNFVGLDNYIKTMSNEYFLLALKNSLLLIVIAVPILIMLALIISLVLSYGIRWVRKTRVAFILPMVIPTASIVLIWRSVFAEDTTVLPVYLLFIGTILV